MNTNPKFLHALLSGLMAAFSVAALADEVRLKLSGDQEVPPVATAASGSGTLVINADMTVSGAITTSGVAATAAHIHLGKSGANGPVLVTLGRSGDNGWAVPAGTKFTEDQYKAYRSGALYVNVHSDGHKGGEIRAQLMPPAMAATPKMGGY